jgi:acetylornithine deacetylase
MKDVEQLLLDLVAIPSVSPQSNAPVIDYVRQHLDPMHWKFEMHGYTDSAGTPKANLVAIAGGSDPGNAELAFVCHTDTVPYEADWNEAVRPVVRESRLYGRGSCDVKGFLACTLAALEQVDVSSLHKPVALILTADEEVGCVGAKHLAKQSAFSTNYMIIGEPTGLQPIRAGKGYGLATITLRGKEAHSAFPAEGRSAIFDAARVLLALEQLAKDLARPDDMTFDPPFTTVNVGLIQGGTAKNIVPGECRLTVEWRPVPGEDPQRIPALLQALLDEVIRITPEVSASLEVLRSDPAFAPSPTQRIAGMLTAMTGNEPSTIAFGSEAAHLRTLTRETVVFGPGDMTVAHKSGEYVPVPELHRCVEYLRAVTEKICSNPQTTD